jgi:hypothetical protein
MRRWLRGHEPGLILAAAAACSAVTLASMWIWHGWLNHWEQTFWVLIPVLWAVNNRAWQWVNRRLRTELRELGERVGKLASHHTGIRVRIDSPAGVLLEGDSDFLHMVARMHNLDSGQQADLFSADQPWHEVLQTNFGLRFWIQPVQLPDFFAEDEAST